MMMNGGGGIRGLINEPVFAWLYSPEGLSELGILSEDVDDLVVAHRRSYNIRINANQLVLGFGDIAFLKASTPHPYDGVGKLAIGSWLEWVYDGEAVKDAGFVARDDLPDRLDKYIRLPHPLGGLMLLRGSFGSPGVWRVPSAFNGYLDKWVVTNKNVIQDVLTSQLFSILTK